MLSGRSFETVAARPPQDEGRETRVVNPRHKLGHDKRGVIAVALSLQRQKAIACRLDMLYTMIEVIGRTPKWLKAPAISKAQHVFNNIIERSSHARA
ncbi:hypothetical protein FHR70_003215 [Microvirga lupini]|uniref:Uncharacterized protein n=1 Tax=Microvirga lupini TaxID=420324 RepID=A0A7W4YYC1_9HYPH|nr:hypothetical protein [Microvirga lupini]MBB3020134.1 hypothetical protein [Microvirga lupini]